MNAALQWAVPELIRGASQTVLVWASVRDCPACYCTPTLHCPDGQTVSVVPAAGTQSCLLAITVAFSTGCLVGALACRWLLTGEGVTTGLDPVGDLARQQAEFIRSRRALRPA